MTLFALRPPFSGSLFARLAAVGAFVLMAQAALAQNTVGDLIKAPQTGPNPVVAKVDGVELHKSDVVDTLRDLPPQVRQMPVDQVYPVLIDRMVSAKLIVAAGKAQKLQDDKEVKEKVALYQDRAIQEVYLNRAVKAKITDQALHARYDAMLKENPPQEEVHARHILVAGEQDAKDIIAQLGKGAKFEDLAKAKSTDSTAKDGGDLGFFTKEDMVPEFADVAFTLKPGEYSKTPVKTQFGYHVIKVEERRKGKAPTFEESKEQITGELSQEMFGEIVDGLRKKSKIETFALDGSPMPAPAKP